MQVPGILHRGVQEPDDDGQIPLFATDLDLQVVAVLVKSVYAAHAGIVLSDDTVLLHIHLLLGCHGIPAAGGDGLCPQ